MADSIEETIKALAEASIIKVKSLSDIGGDAISLENALRTWKATAGTPSTSFMENMWEDDVMFFADAIGIGDLKLRRKLPSCLCDIVMFGQEFKMQETFAVKVYRVEELGGVVVEKKSFLEALEGLKLHRTEGIRTATEKVEKLIEDYHTWKWESFQHRQCPSSLRCPDCGVPMRFKVTLMCSSGNHEWKD